MTFVTVQFFKVCSVVSDASQPMIPSIRCPDCTLCFQEDGSDAFEASFIEDELERVSASSRARVRCLLLPHSLHTADSGGWRGRGGGSCAAADARCRAARRFGAHLCPTVLRGEPRHPCQKTDSFSRLPSPLSPSLSSALQPTPAPPLSLSLSHSLEPHTRNVTPGSKLTNSERAGAAGRVLADHRWGTWRRGAAPSSARTCFEVKTVWD